MLWIIKYYQKLLQEANLEDGNAKHFLKVFLANKTYS